MTRTGLLEHYLKPTDLTVKELIDRNAFSQIMQFAEAHHLEQLRLGSVSNCYDESDMRYVFECFDSGDTFENQIKEFNAPI